MSLKLPSSNDRKLSERALRQWYINWVIELFELVLPHIGLQMEVIFVKEGGLANRIGT